MAHQQPLISICVPAYNGEKYLRETLDSISQQTYDNYEVIISDDLSTDNTLKIANEYAMIDGRVKVYKNTENLGLVENWNNCIKLAQSEWIKFVFQDDTIEPRCLELMAEATKDGSEFIVCWRDFLFESNVDRSTRNVYLKGSTLENTFGETTYLEPATVAKTCLRNSNNFIGEPTSTMFKKSLTERCGSFNTNFVQRCDLEYWVRIGLNVGIRIIPETLAHFRVHTESTSAKNKTENSFRSSTLERLILLHEYCYNKHFSTIRKISRESDINRRLKVELARQSYWLKNIAYDASKSNKGYRSQWDDIAKTYPKLESSIYMLPLNIKRWIDRNITWRFTRHGN